MTNVAAVVLMEGGKWFAKWQYTLPTGKKLEVIKEKMHPDQPVNDLLLECGVRTPHEDPEAQELYGLGFRSGLFDRLVAKDLW